MFDLDSQGRAVKTIEIDKLFRNAVTYTLSALRDANASVYETDMIYHIALKAVSRSFHNRPVKISSESVPCQDAHDRWKAAIPNPLRRRGSSGIIRSSPQIDDTLSAPYTREARPTVVHQQGTTKLHLKETELFNGIESYEVSWTGDLKSSAPWSQVVHACCLPLEHAPASTGLSSDMQQESDGNTEFDDANIL